MVGGMESKVLCIISLLCPRLQVLLRFRGQSQAGAVQHKTLGTLEPARIWGRVLEEGEASGADGLGWTWSSVLGRHTQSSAREKPAINLTAQITDFCLYNYT